MWNSVWSQEKSLINSSTVKQFLYVKLINDLCYSEFFEEIKTNKKKVYSSEKWEWSKESVH